MSLGDFDISDPSIENQMKIQSFGDELAQKIAENPEFYLNDFIDSFTIGWIFIFILTMTPPIWFGLATYYKRVSALFYDQRKEIFTALILFEIVSDYIVLSNSGIITTIVSLIGFIIYAFLTFNNSKFEEHEGYIIRLFLMRNCNFGWGGRIRTYGTRDQNPMPYHLATPH